MTWAQRILTFQKKLNLEVALPAGVEVMNPYRQPETFGFCEKFYTKFYNDRYTRMLIIGINPGRFGGGITGIPFTDPVKLQELGIPNSLDKKRELSAEFIYKVVEASGGASKFYKQFYISSVSPLGFVYKGKNLNYYDHLNLPELLHPFIVMCMKEQLSWGISRDRCFCLGEGKNFKFVKALNIHYNFFKEVVPLPHPRFIMQYRRKRMEEFVSMYLEKLLV
ncbi:MAG: DUF4918 family protein [Bacteroidetes bacterium]|nr:DUF4918 family protein [Bacteroidota bacterium]